MALYGLRWRIENIFKTWKSNFSFGKVHTVSEQQLRVPADRQAHHDLGLLSSRVRASEW
jgi:hypothetical protein